MPNGKPRTTAERRKRHLAKYGTLKSFSLKRKGKRQ